MKYFSTFTGIGVFEKAIHNVFDNAECVGYSEIDQYAENSFLHNFPYMEGLNFGDIKLLTRKDGKFNKTLINKLPDFDLLVGGPNCQDLSIAKSNRQGLKGSKSSLFFDLVAILKVKKPKYFLVENVASMSRKDRDIMSEHLGVEPHLICSDRFTPQKRNRLYWYNWDNVELPEEGSRWPNLVAWSRSTRYPKGKDKYVEERETIDGRANTLTTGKGCGSFSSKNFIIDNGNKRLLTPNECELLQGLPLGYTVGSDTQRYRQIGNCVTLDVVNQILLGLKNNLK